MQGVKRKVTSQFEQELLSQAENPLTNATWSRPALPETVWDVKFHQIEIEGMLSIHLSSYFYPSLLILCEY